MAAFSLASCDKDEVRHTPDDTPEEYSWQLSVESPPVAPFFAQHTQPYVVKSVCVDKETGEKIARNWKIVGFESKDGAFSMAAKPDWIDSLTLMEGKGGEAGESGVAKLSLYDCFSEADLAVRKAKKVGSKDKPYDLSLHNKEGQPTSINTANTYVVSAAGYYSLPLVFGNAIKEGQVNVSAFRSARATDMTLDVLVDAKGQPIRSPYIEGGVSAKLLWADEAGVVKNVRLSADNKSLCLEIDSLTVRNANALVGVLDDEERVLWSWHVWVAPSTVLDTKVCMNYLEMPIVLATHNLGWKDERMVDKDKGSEKSVRVKVKQMGEGGQEVVFEIKRAATQMRGAKASDLKYQWGRKDPFINDLRVAEGRIVADASDQGHTIAEAISRPCDYFAPMTNPPAEAGEYAFTNLHNWSQQLILNLWRIDAMSSGHNVAGAKKTIYDPTPVGYKVPIGIAFNGFTKAGRSSNKKEDWNVVGEYAQGWLFRSAEKSSDALFFAASGYLNGRGKWVKGGEEGYYWTCNPATGHAKFSGWSLAFSSKYVSPRYFDHYCSMGQSVRPMKE